ncbi:MAG: type II toxin-antitoxin system PemK/MazF family toxin [Burkholderiales bacterium]
MKRGELYIATPPRDYGKPRPVVIVQSDLFLEARDSVTVCLLSSELIDAPLFRVRVKRAPHNRLKRASDVMADKLMTLRKERLGESLGTLSTDELVALDQGLRRWLAL